MYDEFRVASDTEPVSSGALAAQVLLLPVEGDHKPVTYLPKASFRRLDARFSPDGLWMAYQSDESGRNEVYVQAVPASSEKVTISSGGGVQPRWRRDGKELYYIAPGRKLMSVTVKTGAKFEAGVPRQILEKLGVRLRAFGGRAKVYCLAAADGGRCSAHHSSAELAARVEEVSVARKFDS